MEYLKNLKRIVDREDAIKYIRELPDGADLIVLASMVKDDPSDPEGIASYQHRLVGEITFERAYWMAAVFQSFLRNAAESV